MLTLKILLLYQIVFLWVGLYPQKVSRSSQLMASLLIIFTDKIFCVNRQMVKRNKACRWVFNICLTRLLQTKRKTDVIWLRLSARMHILKKMIDMVLVWFWFRPNTSRKFVTGDNLAKQWSRKTWSELIKSDH